MPLARDTCLVASYTRLDDLSPAQVAPPLPRGPGKPPILSDREGLPWALYAPW